MCFAGFVTRHENPLRTTPSYWAMAPSTGTTKPLAVRTGVGQVTDEP